MNQKSVHAQEAIFTRCLTLKIQQAIFQLHYLFENDEEDQEDDSKVERKEIQIAQGSHIYDI